MMDDHVKLVELEIATRKEFPGFRVVKKSESGLMKTIDIFLKVITLWKMKDFMTMFITTIGEVVYVPDSWEKRPYQSKMVVLRHERVHMRQGQKYTKLLYSFLYLFFPLPTLVSYFRMRFEREAYEESLRAMKEYYGIGSIQNAKLREDTIKHFTSAEYFWMWPWKKSLGKWYDGFVEKLKD
jgi:hypothetical protein